VRIVAEAFGKEQCPEVKGKWFPNRLRRTKLTNKCLSSNHFTAWYSQTALVSVALLG
jgi:hypothetical protein